MDLVMPVMDGFEATRRLRRLPEHDRVVVIALSASVFEHNRQQSLEAGCNDFLQKPVRLSSLLDALQAHLGLAWIYDETPAAGEHEQDGSVKARPLEGPPVEEVRRLYELVRMGHVQGLLERLDALEVTDGRVTPFANRVRRMARDYDMKQIRLFLEPYLEGQR